MILSADHIQYIRNTIESSEISRRLMQEDLIDHLCCAVEDKMKVGINFTRAFQDSVNELASEGFKELERETYYLLNYKVILMKKFKYSIMLLSSMSFCFGIAARTLHLSIGNDFLLVGLAGLTVGIPLLSFKPNMSMIDRIRIMIALTSLIFVTGGFALKIGYMAGADMFVVIGSCLFAVGFLPLYFLKMYRASLAH
ncbi:MAG: hypothetical protein QM734_01645 [Cyclobacteriaceae bacterium]